MLLSIRKNVFNVLPVLCLKGNFSGSIHLVRKRVPNFQLGYCTFLRTFCPNIKTSVHTHLFKNKNVKDIQHICNHYLSISSRSYGAKKSNPKNSKGKTNKTIDDLLDELSDDEEEPNQEPTEYSHATTPAAKFVGEFQKLGGKKGK